MASRQLKITAFFNSPASETSADHSARKQMQEHLSRNRQLKSTTLTLLDDSDTEVDDDANCDHANKPQAQRSKRVAKPKSKSGTVTDAKPRPTTKRRNRPDEGENQVPTIVIDSEADQEDTDAGSEDSSPVNTPRKTTRAHLETLDSSPEIGQEKRTPKRRRVHRIASSSDSSRSPSPVAVRTLPSSQTPVADGIIGMKVRSPTSNGSP